MPTLIFIILFLFNCYQFKLQKKKKEEIEFTADSLDNTAPVKQILEEVRHKNGQVYSYYGHVIRQRITTKKTVQNFHYVVPGHPLNAFSEDWDGQLVSNYFDTFPYKSLNPKIITEMHNIDKTDPVTHLMKVKSDWQWEYRNQRVTACKCYTPNRNKPIHITVYTVLYTIEDRIKLYFVSALSACSNMLSKYTSINDTVVHCPKHLVDMAVHLDKDPDPYFDNAYNWYYAGSGNLQLIHIQWKDYLLHSVFNKLCKYII